jgi:hypothetical protein
MQVFDDLFQAESGWNCSSILTLLGSVWLVIQKEIYFALIDPTLNTLAFTHQVILVVETELPEDGADERRFASEYQPNGEIWCMKDSALSFGVMKAK